MKVEIVEAGFFHVMSLLENMRDDERALCEKMYGANLEREAARIFSRSLLAYAGFVDNTCVVVWGVYTSFLAGEGYIWLLGSKFIEEHPVVFLRHSRRQLRELIGTFPKLCGVVLTEYDCGQRWLEWLGFEIGPDQGGIRPFRI